MKKARLLALFLIFALGGAGLPDPASADAPAVARPRTQASGGKPGVVFFTPARSRSGVAAVGTAHNANLPGLVETNRVEFWLGSAGRRVATSVGFLTPPGEAFNARDGTLAGDFVAYALNAEPEGVRVLPLDSKHRPESGDRVYLLGIPSNRAQDEIAVRGRVVAASSTRIEVDLDRPYDLRGWGGAPLLSDDDEVIGILQANFPKGSTSRIIAGPIRDVARALKKPLEGGAGRPFASFADHVAARVAAANPPAETEGHPREATRRPPTLIKQERRKRTQIHLNIEYPPADATVSDSICGTFVAGRALALQGALRRFDVVLVLDTSQSTADATGEDINGNGKVGKSRLGRLGSMFDMGSTDPGDSILAAEVAAARQLLRGLDPRSTRVGLVRFAGEHTAGGGGMFSRGPPPPAYTEVPLTSDYAHVERALDDILERAPSGATHMAAGVDQATIELLGLRGALSKADPDSEKVVFFFTDGQPTLPYGPGFEADNVRAVLRASNRASRGGIRIHSFAIGPDALDGPIATVEMASRTEGYFTPVRHPGDLIDVVEQVSFANLDEVSVRSTTTGQPAHPFRATADGTWGGFVKMVPGKNEIEIHARADDGTEARKVLRINFVPEAPPPTLPDEMMVQRNRLLEDCLREVKRLRLEAEKEHAEDVRKDLLVEIEQERARARERAAEQRKTLELEVGND